MNKNCFSFSFADSGIALQVLVTGKGLRLKYTSPSAQDPGNVRGIHSHYTYEVFFVTEGQLELVTDTHTTVYERKTVIIPPQLRHYTFSRTEGSFCLLFSLGAPLPDSAAGNLKAVLSKGICTLEMEEDSAFYISQAAKKLESGDAADLPEAKLLLELLFRRIIRGLLPKMQETVISDAAPGHMNAIEQYINTHLSQKITPGDVAANVHLSTRQINRIIGKEWGCSLVELVTQKKLAKAQMLLKSTTISVGQIAAAVNMGSPNYFYTLFKRRFGMSPLQYRKRHTTDRQ